MVAKLRLYFAAVLLVPHGVLTAALYPQNLPSALFVYPLLVWLLPHGLRHTALWYIRWIAWKDMRAKKLRIPFKQFLSITRTLWLERFPADFSHPDRKEGE